jgi:hypothetical protein
MKKKQRSTAEEIYPLIKAVEQNEMSREAFCRKTGLKKCSFHYWLKKFRNQNIASNSFIELPELEVSDGRYEMELEFRNGVKLRFSSLAPVAYLSEIIQQGC